MFCVTGFDVAAGTAEDPLFPGLASQYEVGVGVKVLAAYQTRNDLDPEVMKDGILGAVACNECVISAETLADSVLQVC